MSVHDTSVAPDTLCECGDAYREHNRTLAHKGPTHVCFGRGGRCQCTKFRRRNVADPHQGEEGHDPAED